MEKLGAEQLSVKSAEMRKEILKMTTCAGSGHPGGSLSATDIVVALYYREMKHKPDNPLWGGRDKFVLSKGHACPLLYAVLADLGYFPKEELGKLRTLNSMLQGHPSSTKTPGIEISTGSLGQGLSVANGMALASKLDKSDSRIYCLLGDGELQEGQVWEAAMTSAHYKLDNLLAIVDFNRLQIDGFVEDVMGVEPIADKFSAFGWNSIEIDGHDFEEIISAFAKAKECTDKPTVIVAKTTKCKGVSFIENVCDYHGKTLTSEELQKAIGELDLVCNIETGEER